jgi:rhodanese-related sulfurtransferase
MNLIGREELKRKLDRGEPFKLVMALHDWGFRQKHIPGSIFVDVFAMAEALEKLSPDEEIVLYCTGGPCPASRFAYKWLEARGYRHLRRYPGGLADWEAGGYPLEGVEDATATRQRQRAG